VELPPELLAWRIHPTFHVSLIRTHVANDDGQFPRRDTKSIYDFGVAGKPEWFVDEIISHRWVTTTQLEFQIRWTLGDTSHGNPSPSAESLKLSANTWS